MAIGITFLEKYEPLPRNTLCLFDRFGNRALTYAKVHTCDFGDECRLTAGDDFYVCDLDVENEKVKIGAMICYDREFPESARILMLKSAEIILVPNACAFDGMAYKPYAPCSRDTLIIEAGEQEGIYIADFPIEEIRNYRQTGVHANAYRHPQKYGLLVDEHIEEPFIRSDYRK